jgi:glycine/D-amino acid oxidase-like deaminating enzyme
MPSLLDIVLYNPSIAWLLALALLLLLVLVLLAAGGRGGAGGARGREALQSELRLAREEGAHAARELREEVGGRFDAVTHRMVLECGGNGRSFFQPQARGNQWTNGGAGCAEWTGARLSDVLKAAGVPCEVLDRAGCIAAEPGLAASDVDFVGGLRLPHDETGDCFLFTNALAKLAAERGWHLSEPTLMRTYMKTTLKDGDGDPWVERKASWGL